MRILGVALLTIFLFALARFVFLQPDVQGLVGLNREDRISHDLVSSLPPEACEVTEGVNQHTFIVRESDTWTALAGSPGYNAVSFNMPKSVQVVSGILILDVATNLQPESVGRLRVNVNGERRGEIILEEGVSSREIRVDLLPSDLTHSQLEVNLAAFGAFPSTICQSSWNGGMIIRIEPSSRIELVTEGPLEDLNDRLRSTGNPYQMQWPETHVGTNYEQLIAFGVDQRLRDIRTNFVPVAAQRCPTAVVMTDEDLLVADHIMQNARREYDRPTWPIYFALDDANREARFFSYETAWRYDYDLRTTPKAEYPTDLDIGMTVSGLQPDAEWLVSVTLNDQSIFAERFSGDTLEIERSIALPQSMHQFSNNIEIRLISSDIDQDGICVGGSTIMAQLHASTALQGGVPAPNAIIGNFINALTGVIQLDVSNDLNAAEASSTVEFLADTFGERTQWTATNTPDLTGAFVHIVTRRELEQRVSEMTAIHPDHNFRLVWPSQSAPGELPYNQVAMNALSVSDFLLNEGPRIIAIVAIPELVVPAQWPTPLIQPPISVQEE
ncbi:hypothetical protein SAMN06273572_101259 [Monaibacterium marinum]|uniref:Cellulose synthase regulatory subunit n=1 Tax=Pontivivens marinum TaxID=1690039 RepID=A0A2C9CM78_9RHOB|nr:hypothetical protein [Monaibacterium marinum]SOH92414.1 hypothetical protein SAMN06273572_101259 [Monaibacterium marinum]